MKDKYYLENYMEAKADRKTFFIVLTIVVVTLLMWAVLPELKGIIN